jgi:hypothetical protein
MNKNMYLVSILVFQVFTFNENAFASQACQLSENSPISNYYFINGESSDNCDEIVEVEKLVSEINEFSDSHLKINLLVSAKASNASFDGGSIIEFPRNLIVQGNYGQEYSLPFTSNMTVVGHEYGHALLEKIFEKELLAQFPNEVSFIAASLEISNLRLKIEELNEKGINTKDLNLELESKRNKLLTNKNFIYFARLTTAYSELYADVVAAFHDNAKDTMLKALYYDEMKNFEFYMIQTRTFNTEFDSKYDVYMKEEHGMFAMTRNYIGKKMWPKNVKEKRLFLDRIGRAIVLEVKSLMNDKKELSDFKKANDNLIKRLESLSK